MFVSDARSTNELARDLANALYLENIPFFHYLFQNPIGWGQRWEDQLAQVVAASKIFMPLIDGSYSASEHCRKEYEVAVRLAEAGQITIVPLLVDGPKTGPAIPYQGADLRGQLRQRRSTPIPPDWRRSPSTSGLPAMQLLLSRSQESLVQYRRHATLVAWWPTGHQRFVP